MSNNLQPKPPAELQPVGNTANIERIDTFNAHVDTVQNNYWFGNSGMPQAVGFPGSCMPPCMNYGFYNLLVVGTESFSVDGTFQIRKDLALQDTEDSIFAELNALDTAELEKIRSFPTIVATPNRAYGKADATHTASYGFINGIMVHDTTIQFRFTKMHDIPQQLLIDKADSFGIGKASAFCELDRIHWAVKRVNIVDALRSNGVQIMVFSY